MKQPLFLALVALFFLTSCNHYYYSPNTLQIPTLRKQHDASISVARYVGGEVKGFEAQAIYSPIKYVGVMFNHLKIPKITSAVNDTEWGRGRMTEGGIGAYYPYHAFTLSLFGGYGGGWSENDHGKLRPGTFEQNTTYTKLQFRRWSLQPALSVKVKWLQFGFGMRRVSLNIVNRDYGHQIDPIALDIIKKIDKATFYNFWENGFSMGLKLKACSLTFNKVWLSSRKYTSENSQFNKKASNVCFTLNISEFWQKKKEMK